MPEALRQHGRVQLLEIEAGLAFGDLETVGRGLTKASRSSTTRKGDEILTDLWFRDQCRADQPNRRHPERRDAAREGRARIPAASTLRLRMTVE